MLAKAGEPCSDALESLVAPMIGLQRRKADTELPVHGASLGASVMCSMVETKGICGCGFREMG